MGNETPPARKVMVVAEPNRESAGALQYALSHVVAENDELILVHIDNPNIWKNTFSFLKRPSSSSISIPGGPTISIPNFTEGAGVDVDFLEEMKKVSEIAQPKIHVRTERVNIEAKDKAHAILIKSNLLEADLLIVGQRRSFSSALLGKSFKKSEAPKLQGPGKGIDTADYLIKHSKCNCVAVQKKGNNGGYLLNTKTHKNFWLLA